MASAKPDWVPKIFAASAEECPVLDYLREETDARLRAKIIKKIEFLATVGREDAVRPLADTLEGAVKELRVDKQVRILFSWEDGGILLILDGTRKKNGRVDQQVVRRAGANRERWLEKRTMHASLKQLTQALGG